MAEKKNAAARAAGIGDALGWAKNRVNGDPRRITVPAITMAALASSVKAKLEARGGIRVIGRPDARVQKIALLPGTHPIQTTLAVFPEVVRGAAFAREPHRVPTYLMETAAEFHRFYHACRVVGDDREQSRARLAIAAAARQVLANGLALLGMTAPARMERAAEALS